MTPQDEKRRIERDRMRLYRVTHKAHLSNYNRARWAKKRRYQRRAGTLGDRKCLFCEVLLKGKSVAMKHTKYCNGCTTSPVVKRYLKALYRRRWLQKKAGRPQEEITLKIHQHHKYKIGRTPMGLPQVPTELSTDGSLQPGDVMLS